MNAYKKLSSINNIRSILGLTIYLLTLTHCLVLSLSDTLKSNKKCVLKRYHAVARPHVINGYSSLPVPYVVGVGGLVLNEGFDDILYDQFMVITCTGSIISSYWVITVIRCFQGVTVPMVVAGTNEKNPQDRVHYFHVTDIIHHEHFNETGRLEHNIAIAKVARPFSELLMTQKVCFPSDNPQWFYGLLVGYGRINPVLENPFLTYNALFNQETICMHVYKEFFDIDKQTCGGIEGTTLGWGDLGAPLLAKLFRQVVLLGVASWDPTGGPSGPIIFTKTTPYLQWIENKTEAEMCIVDC